MSRCRSRTRRLACAAAWWIMTRDRCWRRPPTTSQSAGPSTAPRRWKTPRCCWPRAPTWPPPARAFTEAARLYLGLGAAWDLRRADARLRRYGIRRARGGRRGRPAQGWEALTPTEAKIAALVAEGRSNPDIAAELFLSRNTVQTHVSHILAKLGARSRAEIIRQALGHADGERSVG